ncbi:hypothetical protein BH11ACT6_BH11ACT6_07810 [soil metagenome]
MCDSQALHIDPELTYRFCRQTRGDVCLVCTALKYTHSVVMLVVVGAAGWYALRPRPQLAR